MCDAKREKEVRPVCFAAICRGGAEMLGALWGFGV